VADRLYGDYSSPLPTSKEIGSQLGVPVRNVNAQIHYLTEKFRLTPLGGHHRPGWRREALADHIIKNRLLMADRIGEGSQECDHTQRADDHEVGRPAGSHPVSPANRADDHTNDVQLALGPHGRQVAQVVTGEHDGGIDVQLCDEAAQHSALSMPDGRSSRTNRPGHDLEPDFGADLFGPMGAGPHSGLQGSGI
jgi:hypothetical protein